MKQSTYNIIRYLSKAVNNIVSKKLFLNILRVFRGSVCRVYKLVGSENVVGLRKRNYTICCCF